MRKYPKKGKKKKRVLTRQEKENFSRQITENFTLSDMICGGAAIYHPPSSLAGKKSRLVGCGGDELFEHHSKGNVSETWCNGNCFSKGGRSRACISSEKGNVASNFAGSGGLEKEKARFVRRFGQPRTLIEKEKESKWACTCSKKKKYMHEVTGSDKTR